MKITWEVDDGYVGKSAPHHLEIPDEELEGMDEEEKQAYIHDRIQDDFEQKVSWTYKITG